MKKQDNQNKIKSEMAYKFLKDKIESGEYASGHRIVIHDVALQLEISDTPVREALKKLASENLIELESHKGAKVTPVNIENLEELFLIRLELETLACRLAVRNATSQEIVELDELVWKMDESLSKEDNATYAQYNTKFHNILYHASHSPVLIDMLMNLYSRSERSRMIFQYAPYRNKASNEEHRLIVDGLKEKNEKKAMEAIRMQKEAAFTTIINTLKMSKQMLG